MGWTPGEGLGKGRDGPLEPLVLDIKSDRKGLRTEKFWVLFHTVVVHLSVVGFLFVKKQKMVYNLRDSFINVFTSLHILLVSYCRYILGLVATGEVPESKKLHPNSGINFAGMTFGF